jgi:putative membrane protein
MTNSKQFIADVLKGISIGTANVIPGVSGGTMAVITGIFEKLLNTVKSFNPNALKLLLKGDITELKKQIDFPFVIAIGTGMVIAIFTMAKLFGFLFDHYPVLVWAFFFGLIAPSIYYVSKSVDKWSAPVILSFAIGAVAALSLAFLSPAVENKSFMYVLLCGVLSISAMILPGISGSFVLILMGNYQLIVLKSISAMDMSILIPFGLGCVAGLIAFAHLLSYIIKRFKNPATAVLTGFVVGSLIFVWPWKTAVFALDSMGQILQRKGENVVLKYDRFIPDNLDTETVLAISLAIIGALIVIGIEKRASK